MGKRNSRSGIGNRFTTREHSYRKLKWIQEEEAFYQELAVGVTGKKIPPGNRSLRREEESGGEKYFDTA